MRPGAGVGWVRLSAVALVLLGSTGCFLMGDDGGLDAEELPFTFAEPRTLSVRSGETLATIAVREGVSVVDLIAWNGLMDDHLEVGQVLFVWPPMPPEGTRVASVSPRPKPKPTLRSSLQRLVTGTPEPEPPPPEPEVVQVASNERRKIEVQGGLVRGSGILGVEVSGSDVDLEGAAAGMARHETDLGENALGDRDGGLGAGGTADSLAMQKRELRDLGPKIPNTPVTPPRLTKPAPKRCLSGPSAVMGEDGMVTSQGLSVAQINAGMAGISRQTSKCFPSGTEGSYTVIVEVTVGCDGRVSNVFTIGAGVVPTHVTSCIEQTLGYASFPAHAVPDGMGFQYPLKFNF